MCEQNLVKFFSFSTEFYENIFNDRRIPPKRKQTVGLSCGR